MNVAVPNDVIAELREFAPGTIAERCFDKIVRRIRPAISCKPSSCDSVGIAASKIGGAPDVPAGFDWPTSDARPLEFVAQFRLEDIHGLFPDVLPKSGLLSFFYLGGCFSPGTADDLKGVRVYYSAVDECQAYPGKAPCVCKSGVYTISMTQIWNLPDDEFHSAATGLYDELSDDDQHLLREWLIEEGQSGLPVQLFGYPSREQTGSLQLQCEWLFNGMALEDCPPTSEFMESAADWELLAQFAMDWRPQFESDGYLHYWIRRSDVAAQDFSRVAFTREFT